MGELLTARAVRLDGLLLVAVQRVRTERLPAARGLWVQAEMTPTALVLGDGRSWRAIDLDGRPLALDTLLRDVPDLARTLRDSAG